MIVLDFVYKGKHYHFKSIAECNRYFGGKYSTKLLSLLRRGVNITEALDAFNSRIENKGISAVDHLGKKYRSLSAMARAYDIPVNLLYARLDVMSVESALTTPVNKKNKHFYKGKSIKVFCRENHICVDGIYRRIKQKGMTVEQAVDDVLKKRNKGKS